MLVCLIKARHLTISALMKAAYSSGRLPTGSLACDVMRSCISGMATIRATSVEIFWIKGLDVPPGAMIPNQAVISKSGTPASARYPRQHKRQRQRLML